MPAIKPPAKVLVTGGNGYVANWVIYTLLKEGYSVRTTVRSHDKAAFYHALTWSRHALDEGKLEIVTVEDITKEGAFDDAIKGVEGVVHPASPVSIHIADPDEMIRPAVQGTVGIMRSASRYGSSLKRFVFTSSVASVQHDPEPGRIFTEDDWNLRSLEDIRIKGQDATAMTKYRASKTLAEQGARDFYNENRDSLGWDFVTLNSTWVFGPTLHAVSSPSDLGMSSFLLYSTLMGPNIRTKDELRTDGGGWIDVRDLAVVHLRALQKEAAGGERIIITAGPWVFQQWMDLSHKIRPDGLPGHPSMPRGFPMCDEKPIYPVQFDITKARQILAVGPGDSPSGCMDWYRYRSEEEMLQDVLQQYEEQSW